MSRDTVNQIHCPAYHGPCGRGCFLQAACTTKPEQVMALVERLDEQTTAAMSEIARRVSQ